MLIYYIQPLTVLLSKKNVWVWGPSQEEAFTLKDKLSKLATLTLYNPTANIKLSADASCYRLGAVLKLTMDGSQ